MGRDYKKIVFLDLPRNNDTLECSVLQLNLPLSWSLQKLGKEESNKSAIWPGFFQTLSTLSVVMITLYCTLLDVLDSCLSFHKHPNKTRITLEWCRLGFLIFNRFASLWLRSLLDCSDICGTKNIKEAARKEMPPQQ